MKSYLEIYVPIQYETHWFEQLRQSFYHIPVRWQKGWYHITMAFLNDSPEDVDLRPVLEQHLKKFPAPVITFDKLDVFSTKSGMYIIYLTASDAPQNFLSLTEDIRADMRKSGCSIDADFRLHVTLGRLKDDSIKIQELRSVMEKVPLSPFTLTLTDMDYRMYKGRTLYEFKLKKE